MQACVQVRFVVMGNVFPTETKMDRRFDLKGSSHGRTAGPKKDGPNVILKVLPLILPGTQWMPSCLLIILHCSGI